MAENRPTQSEVQRGRNAPRTLAPGEKPALNETYITSLPEDKQKAAAAKSRKPQDVSPAETGNAGKEFPVDKKLKEGIRLFNMKRWEQALHELFLVKAGDLTEEEKPELAYYLGLCCAKLDKHSDALIYLEQVISDGGDPLRTYQCRMTVAYIYIKTGRIRMAEFELKRLQNAGFESAPLFNSLGYAAYAQKRYRNAIDFYEKSLEIDPDNTTAMNSMGYILADKGIDPLKALRLCRKAVDMRPQNPAYLDSLGWAHYKNRELDEARKLLRQAVNLAPQEKEIKGHFRIVTGGAE